MENARKYLALALAACKTKQYEEAGIFLQQASQEEGSDELIKELSLTDEVPASVSSNDTEENNGNAEEGDWGDDSEDDSSEDDELDEEESVSSVTRRKYTTSTHIGKILAAAMSVSADEGDEAEDNSEYDEAAYDEFEDQDESDPDEEGESLIPASFSSVKVKSLAVESPIKLKCDK